MHSTSCFSKPFFSALLGCSPLRAILEIRCEYRFWQGFIVFYSFIHIVFVYPVSSGWLWWSSVTALWIHSVVPPELPISPSQTFAFVSGSTQLIATVFIPPPALCGVWMRRRYSNTQPTGELIKQRLQLHGVYEVWWSGSVDIMVTVLCLSNRTDGVRWQNLDCMLTRKKWFNGLFEERTPLSGCQQEVERPVLLCMWPKDT